MTTLTVKILNIDCMEYMKGVPDKFFDLAIVDPPYGIGMGAGAGNTRGKPKTELYIPKKWDSAKPEKKYFCELFRCAKNQIIFGGNYFADLLKPSRGWIYWRKMTGGNYADGELAWTSFDCNLKEFNKRSEQGIQRFHPTQKPVELYSWILHKYAKPGWKILDTHLGSGSSAIAAHRAGFDFIGCELDIDYFTAANRRFENEASQKLLMPIT